MADAPFNFQRPQLTEISMKVNPEYDPQAEKIPIVSLKSEITVKEARDVQNRRAVLRMTVDANKEQEKGIPFVLSITMAASFSWEEDVEEDVVESMIIKSAPSLVLSYIRPMITILTSEFGASYDLPFVTFTKAGRVDETS